MDLSLDIIIQFLRCNLHDADDLIKQVEARSKNIEMTSFISLCSTKDLCGNVGEDFELMNIRFHFGMKVNIRNLET